MKKISNEFVTIEYDDKEEELAKYCMEIFNMDKAFYKGLLNGIKVIKAKNLPKIDPDHADGYEKNLNKTILKMNGIEDIEYPLYCIDYGYLYYYIVQLLLKGAPCEDFKKDYSMLACTYFQDTKDFSYLKKLIYDKTADMDDLREICKYFVDNHYEELVREKIKTDIQILEESKLITNGVPDILEIVKNVMDSVEKHSNELYTSYKNSNNTITIPKITDQEFEKLVKEALVYIDPTNNLLEEYLKCKEEGKIKIIENDPNGKSCFRYTKDDYEIKFYKKGDLEDVIGFVHEFSHLHYITLDLDNTNNNRLFDEYFSIYYELKTAEFLEKKGYSKEIITFTKNFRTQNNLLSIPYLQSIFCTSYINMGKNIEDYDLSNVKSIANAFENINEEDILKGIPEVSIEQLKSTIEMMKQQMKMNMLQPANDLIVVLKYTIGTFLAEHSINNLKHEDVLEILEDIRLNKRNLSEVLKMHGINPKTSNIEKQEENNKTKEKIDDKQ